MAHEDHRALILVERVLDRLDALHVQMIGRLVEHEEIRLGERDDRQRDSRALTARE